jgi:hypothetical protein
MTTPGTQQDLAAALDAGGALGREARADDSDDVTILGLSNARVQP